jgi:signal transduction histidine kinase
MQNLISNAIKFRRAGLSPEVWIEVNVADGRATLTVRDNGIGFHPQSAAARPTGDGHSH